MPSDRMFNSSPTVIGPVVHRWYHASTNEPVRMDNPYENMIFSDENASKKKTNLTNPTIEDLSDVLSERTVFSSRLLPAYKQSVYGEPKAEAFVLCDDPNLPLVISVRVVTLLLAASDKGDQKIVINGEAFYLCSSSSGLYFLSRSQRFTMTRFTIDTSICADCNKEIIDIEDSFYSPTASILSLLGKTRGDMRIALPLGNNSDSRVICRSCANLYTNCSQCSYFVKRSDTTADHLGNLCHPQCLEERNQSIEHSQRGHLGSRNWLAVPKIRAYSPGKIYRSRRLVGCEMEVANVPNRVRQKIDPAIGISYDGSIRGAGDYDNAEFVTPPANGSHFEEMANSVLSSLDNSCDINSTCGMHLHFNLADFDQVKMSKLFATYYLTSAACNLWVASGRYGNRYCRPLNTTWSFTMVENLMKYPKNFAHFLYNNHLFSSEANTAILTPYDPTHDVDSRPGGIDGPRYTAQNFHSIFYRGTLEIRNHEGTRNIEDILHYAYFNAQMIAYARGKRFDLDALKKFYEERNRDLSRLSAREDIDAFVELIGLNQTTAKVLYHKARKNYGVV